MGSIKRLEMYIKNNRNVAYEEISFICDFILIIYLFIFSKVQHFHNRQEIIFYFLKSKQKKIYTHLHTGEYINYFIKGT